MIKGLKLFSRTSDRRTINVASYHSPHSLTWSWIVTVSFDGITRKGNGRLRFGVHPHRTSGGLQLLVAAPYLSVEFHQQRPIWFRDIAA